MSQLNVLLNTAEIVSVSVDGVLGHEALMFYSHNTISLGTCKKAEAC